MKLLCTDVLFCTLNDEAPATIIDKIVTMDVYVQICVVFYVENGLPEIVVSKR